MWHRARRQIGKMQIASRAYESAAYSERICTSDSNEWSLIVSIINEGHRADAATTLIDAQWFTRRAFSFTDYPLSLSLSRFFVNSVFLFSTRPTRVSRRLLPCSDRLPVTRAPIASLSLLDVKKKKPRSIFNLPTLHERAQFSYATYSSTICAECTCYFSL